MFRRVVVGAVIALVAGWVLATAATGSSADTASAGGRRPSQLTSLSRACTLHGSSVRSNRWTARRALVPDPSPPLARIAVCRRIAA